MATKANNTGKKQNPKFIKNIDTLNVKAIKTTESLIDTTVHTAEQWQKLIAKAVKNSQPLIEKQKDIVFDALKTIKGQYVKGQKQVNHLVGKDVENAVKQASSKASKTVKSAVNKAESLTKTAVNTTEKNINKVAKMVGHNITETTSIIQEKIVSGDDLQKINGIGPKVAELLKAAGISSYAQLAKTTAVELKTILDKAGSRYSLIDATLWPQEAANLSK